MLRRSSYFHAKHRPHVPASPLFASLLAATLFLFAGAAGAPAQTAPAAASRVTIVLPPRVVAGGRATLAVLGADGKLAPGVAVELENNPSVTTDRTGRGFFQVSPSGGALLAKVSADSAAALEDLAPPVGAAQAPAIAPVISLRDYFSICGSGFSGDADANRVNINGAPALVLAASPECLVVLPPAEAAPGPATISIETAGQKWIATTSLVALAFDAPNPALLPDQKGRLAVRVMGSEAPLHIVVENKAPGVLRFMRGDDQEVVTRGGAQNIAAIAVQAIRSGDFSLRARIRPRPETEAARRYLEAAAPLAPEDLRRQIQKLAGRLARYPHDLRPARRKLDAILAAAPASDFRTLLTAARAAI